MKNSTILRALHRLCGILCVALVMAPMQLEAQESTITTPVSISITDKLVSELSPFVYVNGVLAGAINGVVRLPVAVDSIIEIGLPQARQPLYSLALGPKQFETETAEVVMTSYSLQSGNADADWSRVVLTPNTIADVQLEPMSTGGFEMKLPSRPYYSYREIIKEFGAGISSKKWLETIPEANDESRSGGISHLAIAMNETEHWSGAYAVAVRNSWPSPGYSERDWKITSEPTGAKIMTQLGNKGLTDRNVRLPDLSETFVVLQLDGYLDCPHNDERCTLIDRGAFIDLQCNLERR